MNKNNKRGIRGLSIVTIVLLLGFISLYRNESVLLKSVGSPMEVSKGEKAICTLVLNEQTSSEELMKHLLNTNVYQDPQDAKFVAKWIKKGGTIPNLGTLNKNQFKIPLDSAKQAGNKIRNAIEISQEKLGINEEVRRLYEYIERTDIDKLNSFQLFSSPHKDSIIFRTALYPSIDTTTKVSIVVLQTKPEIDTITFKNKRFKTLSYIPYIGKNISGKILSRMKQSPKNQIGVPNILVRIREHTVVKKGLDLGYAITDSFGIATVCLPSNGYYSFLPVREGYEYGSSKGTRKGSIGSRDVKYTFLQKKHTIRLLDSQTYRRIKEDFILTVRSPKDYKNALLFYPCIFLLAWWLLFFFFGWYDKKNHTRTDYIIPLALMVLSGIGLLAMFSIVNPLTDTLLGSTMTFGALIGIILLALISCVDWGFFYSVGIKRKNYIIQFDFVLQFLRWLSLPLMEKIQSFKLGTDSNYISIIGYYFKLALSLFLLPFELLLRLISLLFKYLDTITKKTVLFVVKNPSDRLRHWGRTPYNGSLPKGFGYIIIIFFFIVLLHFFGDGPEGSGTKVNLLFFQPSELNKYLAVLFIAAFFAVRADRITMFSEEVDLDFFHFWLHFRTVLIILLSLATLLFLYLVVMSDMGPALVLIVTFVFLYAIARKDFKQMLLGISTFLILVWVGGKINENSLAAKTLFALGWLFGWIIFWSIKDKRLYESAIFFNLLLSAFIFLGPLLTTSNNIKFQSVGQRIVDRNDVVGAHMWNNQVLGGGDQVVQGIWSLATGGFAGQGLGKGNPNLVPAFHKDMIFTSIGEEMGWITLLLIVLCLAVIIHRSLVVAYKSGNRFLFFLSSGISIVTSVQFFVIIFGAIGVIPLTGVAVPFLSFGMTSLIINLAVYGIVISTSRIKITHNNSDVNLPYRHVTALGIESFLVVSILLVGILFHYQIIPSQRNQYLIKHADVCNNEGVRLAEYNPRIPLLLKELKAGVLYDRNGLPLATSDKKDLSFYDNLEDLKKNSKVSEETFNILMGEVQQEKMREQRRYYPFSNQLFFMLGDYNTMTLWGINDNTPYGLLAEERFMDQLRGFSTTRKDENGNIKKITLRGENYMPSVFANSVDTIFKIIDRDYSFLIPYLKNGIHGRKVSHYNSKTDKGKRDIYLTVDANLQTTLQQKMVGDFAPKSSGLNSGTHPKLRASVVILNAVDGDMLCSANYPLPNQDTIRTYLDNKKAYQSNERQWNKPAYTDQDLGLTYYSAPGSTAKIMSAIAGFMKLGDEMNNVKYHIDGKETIEGANKEPNSSSLSPNLANNYPNKNWRSNNRITDPDNCSHKGLKEYQLVHLEEAVVWSSNNYFINLVHNKQLYNELGKLYQYVGARVGNDVSGELYPSYYFEQDEFTTSERAAFDNCVDFISNRAINFYQNYMVKHIDGNYTSMNNGALQWAWGQGTLDASPLTMARVASIVYNKGKMPITKYIYAVGANKKLVEAGKSISIISNNQAASLYKYMKEETTKHRSITRTKHPGLPESMGGKTGTPERNYKTLGVKKSILANDGWYICFVDCEFGIDSKDSKKENMPLAIAVRLERVGLNNKLVGNDGGSGMAVSFVEKTVIPALKACNYNLR